METVDAVASQGRRAVMISAVGPAQAQGQGVYFVSLTIRGGASTTETLTPAQYAAVRSRQDDIVLYAPDGSKISMGTLLRAAQNATAGVTGSDVAVSDPPADLTVSFVPATTVPPNQGFRIDFTT